MMNDPGTLTLYHGTTPQSAELLIANGWEPHRYPGGSHCGNPGLLYLTTERENALWYAQEKGSDVVLEVEMAIKDLIVDPEDGIGESVSEELERSIASGMPANFATSAKLPPTCIVISNSGPTFRP